jgi:hypothetical protein
MGNWTIRLFTAWAVFGSTLCVSNALWAGESEPKTWELTVMPNISAWHFAPFDIKENEPDDWLNVNTRERYVIEPVYFTGIDFSLKSQLLNYRGRFQTSRGLTGGFDSSTVLNLAVHLFGIEALSSLTISATALDFNSGTAELYDPLTHAVFDKRDWSVKYREFRGDWALEGEGGGFYVKGISYVLPRNIYLKRGRDSAQTYFPLSTSFYNVDTTAAVIGLGINSKTRREDGKPSMADLGKGGFWYTYYFGFGGGRYEMNSLVDTATKDEGIVWSGEAGVSINLDLVLSSWCSLGVQGELTGQLFFTDDVPDSVHERLMSSNEQGQPLVEEYDGSDEWSLVFGTADYLLRGYGYLRIIF